MHWISLLIFGFDPPPADDGRIEREDKKAFDYPSLPEKIFAEYYRESQKFFHPCWWNWKSMTGLRKEFEL